MNRSVFAPALTLLLSATIVASALAQQAKSAATSGTPPPPAAAKAKFATPVKGEATVQVISGQSKFVGDEIVTVYKLKNMATAPIAMLKIEEYWYSKDGKLVSTATERYKQPFQPGEVIEITARAPKNAGATTKQASLSHANGKVLAKPVKKFD